jgi:hypothetical protein
MPRELVQRTINGHVYEIGSLDPFKALAIFTKLTKLLAPSAPQLMALAKTAGANGGGNLDLFGQVIGAIAERLDEDDVVKTAQTLLSQVLVDGRQLKPAVDFAGDVPTMIEVLAAVVEVEFGGFLQLLDSLPSPASAGSA